MPFPLLSVRQMSPEGENGTKHSCASSTLMAEPTLVPNAVRVDDRTYPASARSGYIDGPPREDAPIGRSQQAKTFRMENLWQQHTTAGISKETSVLLLAEWSKGTNTAYQLGCKRWSGWCQKREADLISCRVQLFLDFITSLFLKGLQYR